MTPPAIAEHLSNLQRLLLIEDRFKNRKPLPSTETIWIAARLLEAMGMTVGAMLRYLRADMEGPPQTIILDPSVAAILARVLIEQAETFQYLCLGQVSREEREFRLKLYFLHKSKEEDKVVPYLPSFRVPGENDFKGVEEQLHKLSLENNSFFRKLSVKIKPRLLSGDSAFFNSSTGRYGRGIPRDSEIAALYKLFSNVIHGTSLGLFASQTRRVRLRLDGYNLMSLSICCAVRLLATCLDEYSKMRPRMRAQLTKLERKWIGAIRGYPLEMWPHDGRKDDGSKLYDDLSC
jgi:hypothetical protein